MSDFLELETEEEEILRMNLSDVDVKAISLVTKGANGKRIFLMKSAEEVGDEVNLPYSRIVKGEGDEWTTFYVVVAEPGHEELPGIADGANEPIRDIWASESEIEKAAHRFMENGALINRMHEDLESVGAVVENAVAMADFTVDGETIKKGSWYIGIRPTPDGRDAINKGEITGVSIQGTGLRRLAKDAAFVPNIPGKTNWVQEAGGLPKYIADIAGDLITERGKSTSQAIQLAVGIAKNWCQGKGEVTAKTRAKACAAVAEWEAKKAKSHLSKSELVEFNEEADALSKDAVFIAKVESMADATEDEMGMIRKVAERLGLVKSTVPVEELDEQAGTNKSMSDSATPSADERISALEKSVGELSEKITPLADLPAALEKLTARIPEPEEKAPTAAELQKQLDEQRAASEKLEANIAKLAEGDSSQDGSELQKGAGGSEPSFASEMLA